MKTVVIAGGTGLLGSALGRRLSETGYRVVNLSRSPRASTDLKWTPEADAYMTKPAPWVASLDGAYAVVNLAGRPLDAARWSDNHLAVVQSSRLLSTRAIARAFSLVSKPPGVLLSGSAVGYYGRNPHEGKATVESLTEQSPPGEDDLAQLCVDWERQAATAAAFAPVVLLRTGLALAPRGGLLQKMWLPFMLGLGGPLGSGQQQTSWVHVDDWARLAHWAMERHVNTAAIAASSATYVAAASYAAPPVADPLAPAGKAPGESEHSKAAAATPAPSAASKNPNASFPSPVAKQYPVTTYNVTAPSPVTNKVFARALGRALHRPAILPLPAFVLKLILGDFAEYALGGQRVVPAAALKDGFQFNHPDIGEALQDVVAKRKK